VIIALYHAKDLFTHVQELLITVEDTLVNLGRLLELLVKGTTSTCYFDTLKMFLEADLTSRMV
jgi:hypothetical protein